MEFQVRYSTLFRIFPVIDNSECFWMGSLYTNTQLMLEFLRDLVLTLNFSYYVLITFLMLLSVIFGIYADDSTHYCKCDQTSDRWE